MFNSNEWQNFSSSKIDDGNYNLRELFSFPEFAGYVNHPEHPFTFQRSRTNPTDKFCNSDFEEKFIENLRKQPKDWKYRTKEIIYNINKSGYRTKEWNDIDWKNSVVLLGCSCTFGVGLAEDETISYKLEKLIGRPVINLGYSAGSNNLILNNSATIIEKFDIPYAVVINWTTADRFRFYTKNDYIDIGPWTNENDPNTLADLPKLYQNMYYDRYNECMTLYYLGKIGKAMWKDRTRFIGISFFDYVAHYTRSEMHFPFTNTARDLLHPGEVDSINVAEYLAQRLK